VHNNGGSGGVLGLCDLHYNRAAGNGNCCVHRYYAGHYNLAVAWVLYDMVIKPMPEAVIVAIITGAFAYLVSLVSVILSSRLTIYRIQQLEKKVEAHNSFDTRLTRVEERAKSNTHRLNKLDGEGE